MCTLSEQLQVAIYFQTHFLKNKKLIFYSRARDLQSLNRDSYDKLLYVPLRCIYFYIKTKRIWNLELGFLLCHCLLFVVNWNFLNTLQKLQLLCNKGPCHFCHFNYVDEPSVLQILVTLNIKYYFCFYSSFCRIIILMVFLNCEWELFPHQAQN